MNSLLEKFHAGFLSAAELTASYIIITLAHRYPGDWLGAKRAMTLTPTHGLTYPLQEFLDHFEPNIKRRLHGFSTIGEVFQHFAFKSTPLSVNRSVLEWSLGNYGLELMFRIPRPEEVLGQQKVGRRCVTVILDKEKASKFILGERDALGFTMHDLIHADHFYHHNHSYQGQLGFYGLLDFCMRKDHFKSLLENPAFEAEFEYLISDMNAYAVHLLKCFKSALIHYHPERDNFFSSWTKNFSLSAAEQAAFENLNSELYLGEQDQVLLNFLEGHKQI